MWSWPYLFQIGSYFGASLCSVDVNRDGSSDLVLIGAPHFYEQMRGGQVSLCPFPRGVSSDETQAGWGLAVGWRGHLGWDLTLFLFCRELSGSVMLSCEGSRATPGAALGQPWQRWGMWMGTGWWMWPLGPRESRRTRVLSTCSMEPQNWASAPLTARWGWIICPFLNQRSLSCQVSSPRSPFQNLQK